MIQNRKMSDKALVKKFYTEIRVGLSAIGCTDEEELFRSEVHMVTLLPSPLREQMIEKMLTTDALKEKFSSILSEYDFG